MHHLCGFSDALKIAYHHNCVSFDNLSLDRVNENGLFLPEGWVHIKLIIFVTSSSLQGAGFPCSNKSCAIMGYYADGYTQDPTTRKTFYLVTGDTNNFLRMHFPDCFYLSLFYCR